MSLRRFNEHTWNKCVPKTVSVKAGRGLGPRASEDLSQVTTEITYALHLT